MGWDKSMKLVSPFFAGLIFGLGLCLSGMTDPHKVLGFLDLAGAWDPSLALVMGGALVIAFVAFRIARGRRTSLTGAPLPAPAAAVDARLIGGSLLFGAGWGLAGLCPGPALVNLGFLDMRAVVFVLAMVAGMRLVDAATTRRAVAVAAAQNA
jgi:uncharacterized membrane protein YedE/YeeE